MRLKDFDPAYDGGLDKEQTRERTLKLCQRIGELQPRLYANASESLLIVLQGMDTSGKDGTTKRVLEFVNPAGCEVTGFKVPSADERAHDYLWRIHNAVPRYGRIGVWNRSHYEDVLVVRVHNLVPPEVWGARYDEINAFEKELVDGGMTIVKVAMFVSLDEQKRRLAARLEDPTKYWKYNPGDLKERAVWPDYKEAYQAVLDKTSTDYAPWHVVPCDKKWYSRLAVTELLIEALTAMDLSWPAADFDLEAERKKVAAL